MAKPTDYEFEGKKLKLCLSVSVVMEIKNRFGSLEKMGEKIEEEDSASALDDVTWIFAALSSAGAAYAKLKGEENVENWTYEELIHLVDLQDLEEIMGIVSAAISGSKETTVEAEAGKNA